MIKSLFTLIAAVLLVFSFGLNPNKNKPDYTMIPRATQLDTALAASMERGAQVYLDFCQQCHMPDGKGLEGVYPPLAASDFLKKNRKQSIHAVKYGLSGEITVNEKKYNTPMPGPGLYDEETVDVLNYIMNSWGNKQEIVTQEEVDAVKE